jgi:hypothetical protein
MPLWIYQLRPLYAALVLIAFIETLSIAGLMLVRRFAHFRYNEGADEGVSGTVQAIGVFYGITVGLIAVGVWNTNSNAADLVSREATAIGSLYRDLGGYPQPLRDELRLRLREYTVFVIDEAWPAQRRGQGQELNRGTEMMNDFQAKLYAFEPPSPGLEALHSATLGAYNNLIEYRRLRIDAVNGGLSSVMWAVIWLGAAISIGVAYFFNISDQRLHVVLIMLMAAFLAIVIFMITVNDKPFYGYVGVSSDPYKLILDRLIDIKKN